MSALPPNLSERAERPADFDPSEWTIIRSKNSKRVAARHKTSGEARKIPKAWFNGETDGEASNSEDAA